MHHKILLDTVNHIATQNARFLETSSFFVEQNTTHKTISKKDLNALAAKHLKPNEMITVVVGDKAGVLEDVKALGYPVVEPDEDGTPV